MLAQASAGVPPVQLHSVVAPTGVGVGVGVGVGEAAIVVLAVTGVLTFDTLTTIPKLVINGLLAMAAVIAVELPRALVAALIVAAAVAGETTAVAVKLIAAALVDAFDKRRRLVFTSMQDVMLTSLALNVPDPDAIVTAKALLNPFL